MATLTHISELVFVGLVSGLLSSTIGHFAHQQKRWWELRVSAYQDLIYALSDLCHYYREHHKAHIERRDVTENYEKTLTSVWETGFPKVRRTADAGAFLLSNEVCDALKAFRSSYEKDYVNSFDYLDCCFTEAEKCLAIVVEQSKRDLQPGWWR